MANGWQFDLRTHENTFKMLPHRENSQQFHRREAER
jgi:hypothetical protein